MKSKIIRKLVLAIVMATSFTMMGCSNAEENKKNEEKEVTEIQSHAVEDSNEQKKAEEMKKEATPTPEPTATPEPTPIPIDIEVEFEYFLQDGAGNNLLGFHMPEGYKFRTDNMQYITIYNGSGIGVMIMPMAQEYIDLYENGNNTTGEIVFEEIGTVETVYGTVKLYDRVEKINEKEIHSGYGMLFWNNGYYQVNCLTYEADLTEEENKELIETIINQLFS